MDVHTLDRLIDLQRGLEARIAGMTGSASDVLEIGGAALDFAVSEEAAFFPILPALDLSARPELGREHIELSDDLELLRWLVSATPDSADVSILAAAMANRIRAHVERDGRLLAQAKRFGGTIAGAESDWK